MSFLRLPVLRHGLMIQDEATLTDAVMAKRIEKTRDMMAANGVVCLIAYSDPTQNGPVCHLTNYPCFGMGRRATVLVGEKEGPFLFTAEPSRNLPRVRIMTACDPEKTRQFLSAACERAKGVAGKGAIGLAGFDNLPAGLVKDTKVLDGLTLRDLSGDFNVLVSVKDEGALRAAKRACALAGAGLRLIAGGASPGKDLWELAAHADYHLRLSGCEDANILINASSRGRLRPAYPAPVRIQAGDTMIACVAVQYARLWGVAAGTFTIGATGGKLSDKSALLRKVREKAAAAVKSSLSLGEAERAIREIGRDAGLFFAEDIPVLSGIGYDLHEYPLTAADRLQDNMTLQMALTVDFEEGTVMDLDMLHIGESGSLRLTGGEVKV